MMSPRFDDTRQLHIQLQRRCWMEARFAESYFAATEHDARSGFLVMPRPRDISFHSYFDITMQRALVTAFSALPRVTGAFLLR